MLVFNLNVRKSCVDKLNTRNVWWDVPSENVSAHNKTVGFVGELRLTTMTNRFDCAFVGRYVRVSVWVRCGNRHGVWASYVSTRDAVIIQGVRARLVRKTSRVFARLYFSPMRSGLWFVPTH